MRFGFLIALVVLLSVVLPEMGFAKRHSDGPFEGPLVGSGLGDDETYNKAHYPHEEDATPLKRLHNSKHRRPKLVDDKKQSKEDIDDSMLFGKKLLQEHLRLKRAVTDRYELLGSGQAFEEPSSSKKIAQKGFGASEDVEATTDLDEKKMVNNGSPRPVRRRRFQRRAAVNGRV
ncbi:hypothetical protein M3Y94_00054700 [Aphelenchoides besseyi]|nr:hypothetical protein M3Y94_00054700 [Aphelenchoides besseyi]KAI6217732.1 hypothetical protein M3Y95_01205300 [Aphelenchoides besseyi]